MFVLVFSALMGLFTVILMIRRKKTMQAHPAKLLQLICIIEGIYVFQSYIKSPFVHIGFYACYFKIDTMLAFLTFQMPQYTATKDHSYDDGSTSQSILQSLIWLNLFLQNYFQIAAMTCNICFCYDLIKQFRSPFSRGQKRMKYYVFFTLCIPMINLLPLYLATYSHDRIPSETYQMLKSM